MQKFTKFGVDRVAVGEQRQRGVIMLPADQESKFNFKQEQDVEQEQMVFSDDETNQPAPPTLTEAKAMRVAFGKYKGKTYGSLALLPAGRHYLRYLLTWKDLYTENRCAIQCLMDDYEQIRQTKISDSTSFH